MSSIVKAGKSVEIPGSEKNQNTVNEVNHTNFKAIEAEGIEEKILNELKQQRDRMISTALKKSRHIDQEAERRADALLYQAQKMSKKIMTDAERKGQKEGYEAGYTKGLKDGEEKARQSAFAGIDAIERLALMMNSQLEEMIKAQQQELVNFSFAVAEKVMRKQVHMSEDAIGEMLEEVLKEERCLLRLFVSEYDRTLDLNISKTVASKLKENWQDAKIILVKEENKLMAETEDGTLDISIDNQIEILKEAVNAAL